MSSKTGGNQEPMKFVRKFGSAAAAGGGDDSFNVPAPPPSFGGSGGGEREERRRSRSRDRRRSSRRSRSRSPRRRSRSRDRDSRRRSRSRERRRSRSPRNDRRRSPTPEPAAMPTGPRVAVSTPTASTLLNPLVRPDILEAAAQGMPVPQEMLEKTKRERKSRWSTTKSFVPGMPTVLPSDLTDTQQRQYLLQLEIEDATRKLRLNDFYGSSNPMERSPSPEPVYDANGKRLNTREVRKRMELEQLRHEKITALLALNPEYKPPADYRSYEVPAFPLAPATVAKEFEANQLQFEEIHDEIMNTPLVGPTMPFESVANGYDKNESPEFYNNAIELREQYEAIRVIRGDGNCFFTSFLVAEIELCLVDPMEMERFVTSSKSWKGKLIELGFNELTTSDLCSTFENFLDGIMEGKKQWKQIYDETFLDDKISYKLIGFLRFVASGYAMEHEADYAPYIVGEGTLVEYCASNIEKMGMEADHIAISSLVLGMGSRIRIQYMDRNSSPNGGKYYNIPENSHEQFEPNISLLYRPGHYDVIYKKK